MDAQAQQSPQRRTRMPFEVQRQGPLDDVLSVDYQTVEGTAKAGVDFVQKHGTYTFPQDTATHTIDIALHPGTSPDPKTFELQLTGARGGLDPDAFGVRLDLSEPGSDLVLIAPDLNGDGRPDLVASESKSFSVWLALPPAANGDLRFSPRLDIPVAATGTINRLIDADFNADGRPDIAVLSDHQTVRVLFNETPAASNSISFAAPVAWTRQDISYFSLACDVDGDGRADLVFIHQDSVDYQRNAIVPGSAEVAFEPSRPLIAGEGLLPFVLARDLNGDGKTDFAVVPIIHQGSTAPLSVFLNVSSPGTLAPVFQKTDIVPSGAALGYVSAGDFDADGRDDLLAGHNVFLNRTPPLATAARFAMGIPVGISGAPVVAADVDGDGLLDLLDPAHAFEVLLARGAPQSNRPFRLPRQYDGGNSSSNGFVVADFDLDGRPDVARSADEDEDRNTSGSIRVYRNQTSPGAVTPRFPARELFALNSSTPAFADLDHDGRLDIAAPTCAGTLAVMRNTVAATTPSVSLAAKIEFPLSPASSCAYASTAADFNGDGRIDIASTSYESVAVSLNATLRAGPINLVDGGVFEGGNYSVAAGDLDGDQRPDIILYGNGVYIRKNLTSRDAMTAVFGPLQSLQSSDAVEVVLSDINMDGKLDMVIEGSILLNTTAGPGAEISFADPVAFSSLPSTSHLAVADFDGDGKPDLVMADSSQIDIRLNRTPNGSSHLAFAQGPTLPGPGGTVLGVAVGDLDGDGHLDLWFGGTHGIDVYDNGVVGGRLPPPAKPTNVVGTPVALDFHLVDLNGDGRAEVVVRGFQLLAFSPGFLPASIGRAVGQGVIQPR